MRWHLRRSVKATSNEPLQLWRHRKIISDETRFSLEVERVRFFSLSPTRAFVYACPKPKLIKVSSPALHNASQNCWNYQDFFQIFLMSRCTFKFLQLFAAKPEMFSHTQLEFETKLKARTRALPRSSPNVATFAFGFDSVRLMLLL